MSPVTPPSTLTVAQTLPCEKPQEPAGGQAPRRPTGETGRPLLGPQKCSEGRELSVRGQAGH